MGLFTLFLKSKETSEPSGSFAHSANSLMIPQHQFNTLYHCTASEIISAQAQVSLPKEVFGFPANPIRALNFLKLARSGNSSFEVN